MTTTIESSVIYMEIKKFNDEDWSDAVHHSYEWDIKAKTIKSYISGLLDHVAWNACHPHWETDPDSGTVRVVVVCDNDNYPATEKQIQQQLSGERDDLYEVEFTTCPCKVTREPALTIDD